MKEVWWFHGTAIPSLECTMCNEKILKCKKCGRQFKDKEEIVCAHFDEYNFHFCSDKCHEAYRKSTVKERDISGVER